MSLEVVRNALLIVLALVSLLAFTMPPTNVLWKAKIAIGEYPHMLLLVASAVFFMLGYKNCLAFSWQLLLFVFVVIASLYPIVSAYKKASELKLVFPNFKDAQAFSVMQLFNFSANPSRETYTYLKNETQELALDFYRAKQANSPCIILVHGGGWNGGDNLQMTEMNRYFADHGVSVAAIQYSLAPNYTCPKPMQDVETAMAYLKANAAKLGINTDAFILMGRSAGGQIALQTAYSLKNSSIKAVIALYAPADMIWGYELSTDNAVIRSKTLITDYVGGDLTTNYAGYAEASALTHVSEDCPPTLLIHGRKDNMVAFDHNTRLIEKLEPAKVPYYFLDLPWATHGCDFNLNGPSGQLTRFTTLAFIRKYAKL